MIPSIELLYQHQYLTPLNYYFAKSIGNIAGVADQCLPLLAAAAVSRFTSLGHVCLDVKQIAGLPIRHHELVLPQTWHWPGEDEWMQAISASRLFRCWRDLSRSNRPLVYDDHPRLYLSKYWQYQKDLGDALHAKSQMVDPGVDFQRLDSAWRKLFADGAMGPGDQQRKVARACVPLYLSIITGGPGTGKTTMVVKMLALLLDQAHGRQLPIPRIMLVAPTGKAAARLSESIQQAKGTLLGTIAKDTLQAIPSEAMTIHRALGVRKATPGRFRYHQHNPLPADILVVDEASMVDLALMCKLIQAAPVSCRLMIIGDKDQLVSVEAGAILGDICLAFASAASKSQKVGEEPFSTLAGAEDCLFELQHSFRFGPQSGIARLSQLIQLGKSKETLRCLQEESWTDVSYRPVDHEHQLMQTIKAFVVKHYQGLFRMDGPEARWEAFSRFQIICAHRKGKLGASHINQVVEHLLQEALGWKIRDTWYRGRAIMIAANSYTLNLYNGDIGLVDMATDSDDPTQMAVYFRKEKMLKLNPARLPIHDTAHALTVHKSQGSEFDDVLVIMPTRPSPVTTRELLYTAVTRARRQVTLAASPTVIQTALQSPIKRSSGLREYLDFLKYHRP